MFNSACLAIITSKLYEILNEFKGKLNEVVKSKRLKIRAY